MASSAVIQTCGSCNGSLAGQGIFRAECSHSFHFPCIVSHQSRLCPICNAAWNHLPPQMNSVNHYPSYGKPSRPAFDDDPSQFFDDEPLLVIDPASHVNSTKVAIKAVPERPAVAASESVSLFTLLVGLKAPPLSEDEQRAPIDIVTVLDVSGSMTGRKLDLVKRAVHFVIDNLGVSDRLSIVAFSDEAKRLLPLRRMTENGREDAHMAVDKLVTIGGTNILKGLVRAAKVLDERRERNPVSSVVFLSDGNDTYSNFNKLRKSKDASSKLSLLPASIFPKNGGEFGAIPVHSFGFGSDHDPVTMHAISDASGGTFSFIGSIEMVQDAFAGCIGGLLSVVSQEVRLDLRSASHGVEIKMIPSGGYPAEILNQGSEAMIKIGDLYADEEKDFLISLSVPKNGGEGNTTLLDITCSYKDAVSKEIIQVEGDLVEIRRPEDVAPEDKVINMEVDRQRNRLYAAESIKEAQRMAETGDLEGATKLLAKKREEVLRSAPAKAGDSFCLWLGDEMEETEMLMGSSMIYEKAGRAFALSGMSSHAAQRATTRCGAVDVMDDEDEDSDEYMGFGAFGESDDDEDMGCGAFGESDDDEDMGFSLSVLRGAPLGRDNARAGARAGARARAPAPAPAPGRRPCFGGYVTPNMALMVNKSQQLNKK